MKNFWNIAIIRKRIAGGGVTETKEKNYDVCSIKCEIEGVAMLLAAIMPHIDVINPTAEKSQQ